MLPTVLDVCKTTTETDHVVFTVVEKVPVKSTETESNCLAEEFEKSVYTC